ncbi:MAG: RsiV family protein [Spirochaetaceae bacterium]|jgi:hypothetical protein|nr:RsiV family protein [Spirochaetaceae bacterium]
MKNIIYASFLVVSFVFASCGGAAATRDASSGWTLAGDGAVADGSSVYQLDERILLYPQEGAASPALSVSVHILDSEGSLRPLLSRALYDGKTCREYADALLNAAKTKYLDSRSAAEPAAAALVDDRYPQSMNWFYQEAGAGVVYGNFVVVERSRTIYEGGAHESHEKECFVLDAGRAAQVRLDEMLKPDAPSALKKQIEERLRAEFAGKAGQAVSASLVDIGFFENSVAVPEQNFFVSPAGLGFVWNPAAIAPYSAGIIEITLPYADIQRLLSAEGEALFQSLRRFSSNG